jgi:hypothetical protein
MLRRRGETCQNNQSPPSKFSLKLGPNVNEVICSHCGKQLFSVCGFIALDGDAYSTYFALLHTAHGEIVVALTISIGKWWDDDALSERQRIAMTVRPSESAFNMRIEEPEKSRHVSFKPLGIALTRKDALASPLRDKFFEVADYIVERDPSVHSYLKGRNMIRARTLHKQ